jgi:hypothetical protein
LLAFIVSLLLAVAEPPVRVTRAGALLAEVSLRAHPPAKPPAPVKDRERVNFALLGEGTIVGSVVLHAPWSDYRGRAVPAGTYQLRYRIQPRLKDHAGTTLYRDFLLLEPSRPGRHPYVMALMPAGTPGAVAVSVDGIRAALVFEGMGNIAP